MKVLVIGSGGREHAVCYKLKQSEKVDKLWCAPGNGGISDLAECVPIKATDVAGVLDFCKKNRPDLVVVTPDDPLMLGMVDTLTEAGFCAFGPKKNAAIIEGSKSFAKELMKKYHIPTAEYEVFDNESSALSYIDQKGAPIVIKADGLALGKGVTVAATVDEAKDAIKAIMSDRVFGDAGARVVIEECLFGKEVSVLCFADGKHLSAMPSSMDHKRAYDEDRGPNTGGMGVICPNPYYTDEIGAVCEKTIFNPTIEAMQKEGCPFQGVLYFGLMLTAAGPKVIEYNARFGDPETQAVLLRLNSDLFDIMNATIEGTLDRIDIRWNQKSTCCVTMASGGYPIHYEKGFEISGLPVTMPGVVVFHAGTTKENGVYKTAGGRVLSVTASADDAESARCLAYEAVSKIHFNGVHYRTDIGKR